MVAISFTGYLIDPESQAVQGLALEADGYTEVSDISGRTHVVSTLY
jgi:phosphoribosylformylglycinamidine (FGAM) synthase PurS component